MNKEERIKNIQKVKDRIKREEERPIGIEIPWEGDLETMTVYKIPLEYLVFNKYNGRILSRTKSLERQNKLIDPETPEGNDTIATLLWESNPERNKRTLANILDTGGQQKPGIITKDGIIIDGNRRAMLLNKSKKYDYFKTVVLPVTIDENPLEIERLETVFQMGEDEKLGYKPIEKYLKAKELYLRLSGSLFNRFQPKDKVDVEAIKKIADWMGEKDRIVQEYLEVMNTMDEYLEYLEYDGIYHQLDEREDPFIKLTKWLTNFYDSDSKRGFDGYRNDDVDDLRDIAFDYIRVQQAANFDGKKFRLLAEGNRENHFFGNKEIWKSFKNYHFEQIETITEDPIDFDSKKLEKHLNSRDSQFYEKSKNDGESFFDENLSNHEEMLGYIRASGQPEKLVGKAQKTLDSINQGHKSFSSKSLRNELEKLAETTSKMLGKNSVEGLLDHIIKLLDELDLSRMNEDPDIITKKAKQVQSIVYQLTKDIRKLNR